MQSQVIRPREAALTIRTLEWFDSCVLAEMSRQFIGPGKLPCTAFPHALVRFFTCRKNNLDLNRRTITLLKLVPWTMTLPVCVLRWALRWELLVYTLLQPEKSQRWIRRFLSESGESDGRGCCAPGWTITEGLLFLQHGQKHTQVTVSATSPVGFEQ